MVKGRIIKGVGGLYTISTEKGDYFCKPRGIFRKDGISPLVGDIVNINILNEKNKEGIIEEIEKRTNELVRPKVANVDLSILVFSAKEPSINLEILDTLIVLSEEQNLEILICINKMDLVKEKDFLEIKNIYTKIGYKILLFSIEELNVSRKLIESIKGKTSVLSGPSGVGKSSITNLFFDNNKMEIGEISKKLGRGKHTTRHAELFKIEENTYLVDSPGFTSINLNTIEKKEDLQYYFKEFKEFIGKCKFSNCIHINEPDCEIKNQIGKNINELRYNRYVKFINEVEKRRQ